MGKKRTLAIILLLCVLGGLIACGRKEKEDEYTYTIIIKMERVLSFGMTIFNIGERAKTNGMIFVQSILVTHYGLNLELGR